MSYPASVATVTVTGTWTYSDGSTTVPTGTVTFQPNTVLQDATDSRIIDVKPLVATLDNTGHISVTLMNTSDVDLQPAGWAYTVTERIAGAQRQYDVFITGTTVDLSTLAPVTSTPQYGYVLTTAVGAPSGVASLDSGGNVPLSQLGNVPGGTTPSSTVVSETSFGQSSTAGIGTTYSRGDHTHGTPAAPTAASVGADPAGAAAAAQAAAIAASAQRASNLSDLANATTARTNLGLGTAATQASTAFDAAGAAAAAQAASQPLDADLTAVAGLSTTGLITRTGAGTATTRTLTGSTETGVNNGDGVAGNPTLTVTAVAPTASAVGDTSVSGGVATHKHAREGFGNVTAQTTFATASSNGAATTVARSDHAHGTPDLSAQYAAFADVSSLGANVTQGTPHLQQRNEPGSVTRLKGQIILGNTTFAANSVLATLNVGGRPVDPVTFLTRTKVGNVQSLINIATNGQVTNQSSITATGTDTINFDGWTFDHA